jgi:hypothetical protein
MNKSDDLPLRPRRKAKTPLNVATRDYEFRLATWRRQPLARRSIRPLTGTSPAPT